ncbi:MAG: HlyD family efflux transporter periplasmic adaptor subunit [Planctomycetaceae bacterium]|nr:HlyD family efflux transporter periplasmic adaptor subunit [Planctomycetaceae bacterium]
MRIAINIAVSLVLLGVGVFCFQLFGQKPEIPKSDEDSADDRVLVETVPIAEFAGPLWLESSGEAKTYRVLTVGAEVAGRIINRPEETRGGKFVNPGDLLFEIDPLNYQLEVQRLQAEIARENAELNSIAVELENLRPLLEIAQEDLQLQQRQTVRIRQLYERKASTETELETMLRQELTKRTAVQTLINQQAQLTEQRATKLAQRQLFEAQLKRAEADVARCRVEAPIAGRLVRDLVEQGNFVRVGDTLVEISDASQMEVNCPLQAEQLGWIWAQEALKSIDISNGQSAAQVPAEISPVDCEVVYEFDGVQTLWDAKLIGFSGLGIDRTTRMMPARVRIEQPHATRVIDSTNGGAIAVAPPVLISGMYVKVRIPARTSQQLYQLPREAVRPGGQIWSVVDGQVEIVPVAVIQQNEQTVFSFPQATLDVGAPIIVSPLPSVYNGMRVREATDSHLGDEPQDRDESREPTE